MCINAAILLKDRGRNWPPAADSIINEWRHQHLVQQRAERDAMNVKEELARTATDLTTGNPTYFFMAADFVSSFTGDTPFFKVDGRYSKEDHGKAKIETRMCGVRVVCGDIDEFWVYYTDNMMPGGANVMIEIMRQAIAELTVRLAQRGFKLPRLCFLYFDNCGENKNKLFMAWASLCVEFCYLDEIEVCYLVTGHTHCYVDQTLGSYSTVRDHQTFISSASALEYLLKNHKGDGYSPPVVFKKIQMLWNLWALEPYLNGKIKYYQVPHILKFKRLPLTAKCFMQYRIFSGRELLPKLPKNCENIREVDKIMVEDHVHVGGRKTFIDR